MLEVVPGPRSQLEDPPGGSGEQLVSHLSQATALHPGGHPVVEAGEDRMLIHTVMISSGTDECAGYERDCTQRPKVKERCPTQERRSDADVRNAHQPDLG